MTDEKKEKPFDKILFIGWCITLLGVSWVIVIVIFNICTEYGTISIPLVWLGLLITLIRSWQLDKTGAKRNDQ